jgi:tRNA uridine 5-carbamoylmethylation protein Kti12
MTRTVFVSRGLPGSGKTTRVQRMVKEFIKYGVTVQVCSSDDYYVCPSCKGYHWLADRIQHAHSWCRTKFEQALKDGFEAVFVDNTNVTVRECRPYVMLAQVYGYEVKFLEPETPWAFDLEELVWRNVHRVPREAIERMLRRWVPNMTVEMCIEPPPIGSDADQPTPDEASAPAK